LSDLSLRPFNTPVKNVCTSLLNDFHFVDRLDALQQKTILKSSNARFLDRPPRSHTFDRGRPLSTAVPCRRRPQWERYFRLYHAAAIANV